MCSLCFSLRARERDFLLPLRGEEGECNEVELLLFLYGLLERERVDKLRAGLPYLSCARVDGASARGSLVRGSDLCGRFEVFLFSSGNTRRTEWSIRLILGMKMIVLMRQLLLLEV